MDYDLSRFMLDAAMVFFILFLMFRTSRQLKREKQLREEFKYLKIFEEEVVSINKTAARLREDINLVAKNPQLARRKLKSKDTIL